MNIKKFRSDIKSRLGIYGHQQLISGIFLQEVVPDLYIVKNDLVAIEEKLSDILSNFSLDEQQQIRWELSRVPVWLTFFRHEEMTSDPYRDPIIRNKFIVSWREQMTYEVGSAQCPRDVFGQRIDLDGLKNNTSVLCFYPVALAKTLRFGTTWTWDLSESITDLCLAYTDIASQANDNKESDIRDTSTDPSMDKKVRIYDIPAETQAPSEQVLTDETESDQQISAAVSAEQQIYDFIRENGVVSTKQILGSKIVGRRRVFIILKKLEEAQRIEKVGRGKYQVCQDVDY
ncbi:MAG: hypothetical protein OXM61_10925 [Candidatus Poribacteria bacterium]|nr:hypothetical protein [Candidatus Poribacteria bacterium]